MLKLSVMSLVFAVASVGAFGALLAPPGEGRKKIVVEQEPASAHGGGHGTSAPLDDIIPGAPRSAGDGHHGAGSTSKIAALPMDAGIVTVNGKTFTRAELENTIQQHAVMSGIPAEAMDGRTRDALEESAYDKLIERELLGTEARRRGLWPSDADVQAQREKLVASLPAGKTFEQALKVLRTDEQSFMVSLRSDIAIGKLFDALKAEQPPVPEDRLRAVYEQNKAKFLVPESARAAHILVKLDKGATPDQERAALEKARAIRAEVASLDVAGFKKVATEKSDDPSAKVNGGDLGSFARGDMVEEFEAAAFGLKEGEVSQPVRSPFGYHVIRGGGVRQGGQKTFDEMKQVIADREGVRAFLGNVDTLLESLKKGASITRMHEPIHIPRPSGGPGGMGLPPPGAAPGTLQHGAAGPH